MGNVDSRVSPLCILQAGTVQSNYALAFFEAARFSGNKYFSSVKLLPITSVHTHARTHNYNLSIMILVWGKQPGGTCSIVYMKFGTTDQ